MANSKLKDGTNPFDELRPFERFAYGVGKKINETHLGKQLSMTWGHWIAKPGLALTINSRIRLFGVENLPKRSMLLPSNHRTYFDQFALLIALWEHFEKPPYVYAPVRSAFFYERPLGLLMNLAVAGNAMYPPVFRNDRGAGLNRTIIDTSVRVLNWSPRTVVVMHPEGRRNPSDNPYEFLPPKSGIARIALASRAPVVPSFVNGLPRSFATVLRQRVTAGVEPVRVFIGPPVPLDDLYERPDDHDAQTEASARVMAAIAALGEKDRAFMQTWKHDSTSE